MIMRKFSFCLCIAAVIALFIIGHFVNRYDNLFFALSKFEPNASISKVDEADFSLTYEAASSGILRTVTNIDTKILGVNYRYGDIMDLEMRSGSFFTQSAQDEKRKVVVLNEKLAFDSLGSFDISGNEVKINGEVYIVTGVIADNMDERILYLHADGMAGSLMTIIDTPEKSIENLKSIGVSDSKYYLANLSEIANVVRQKGILAILIFAVLSLILLIVKSIGKTLALAKQLREINREKYLKDIIKSREMGKFALFSLLSFLETVLALIAFLKSGEIILKWNKYAWELGDITTMAFGGRVQTLQRLCAYSNIAFAVFIGGIILGFINIKGDKQRIR